MDMVYTTIMKYKEFAIVVILVIMDMVYTVHGDDKRGRGVAILVIMDMVYTTQKHVNVGVKL